MYNFLYHFPNFIWAILGVVLTIFDIYELIMFLFGKDKEKKVNKVILIVILLLVAIICFILYPIKNNLVEMPKVAPNTYANAIQLLDSYGIRYESDGEVRDYTKTIVNGQSIKEGKIINKKKTTIILYLDSKNSDDFAPTIKLFETDDPTSSNHTDANHIESQSAETLLPSKEVSDGISEITTTSLPITNDYEYEPNNDFPEATPINVNQNIEGILDSRHDEDYYTFNLTQKGKIFISFNHEKFDDSSHYWECSIYDSNSKQVYAFDIYGNVAETKSDNIRLPAGKYYCKINSFYYKYFKYTFNVNFQDEYDGYEVEDNNDFPQATPINVNKSYIGNIQDTDDKDYFRFEILQKGSISITFNHEQFDNDSNYWEIYLISDEKNILNFYSKGKTSSLTSDLVRLPTGTYYLRITTHYPHSNLDYNFSINYNPENELFESEPNNDYNFATNVNFDVEYTGNIQSEMDIDFYEINIIENNTDIDLNFSHELYDKNSSYWEIYIFDENGKSIAILDKNNERFAYVSVGAREPQTKFYINDLTCGKYYIKICADTYINDDYSFFLTKA